MDSSMPGLPVLHHLPKLAQVRVHCIGDAIQPSHPLMPSSPVFSLSQHEGLRSLSRVLLLETPWTAAYQAPPFMGFPRQEYWSGLPLPSPNPVKKLFQWQAQLFASDDWNTGVSTSASILPTSIQGWFPLRLTDLTPLLSKGLSEVFSSTIVWRHQFFGALPSLRSSSHNQTWRLGRP